jgi:beta-lactamase class A
MKVAVLAALYRADASGTLDLDADVPVVNDFASAKPGAPRFQNDRREDQDDDVWARLGDTATLRWLARHMIVRSSNLATNIVLRHVGVVAVHEVLRAVGATRMRVERGIEDADARRAGIDNVVTVRDLAALLGAIAIDSEITGPNVAAASGGRVREPLAPPDVCAAMLEVLFAQERMEDIAAGLPRGTRIAHKNGWVDGVRHATGIVFPDDAPSYAIAVCTTTPLADSDARALIARIAAQSWADRHEIGRL